MCAKRATYVTGATCRCGVSRASTLSRTCRSALCGASRADSPPAPRRAAETGGGGVEWGWSAESYATRSFTSLAGERYTFFHFALLYQPLPGAPLDPSRAATFSGGRKDGSLPRETRLITRSEPLTARPRAQLPWLDSVLDCYIGNWSSTNQNEAGEMEIIDRNSSSDFSWQFQPMACRLGQLNFIYVHY